MTFRSAAALALLCTLAACANEDNGVTGPSTATAIGILGGSAQSATVGTGLASRLTIHVTDQYGNGMANIPVTFTTTGGATLASSSATTDASGNATDSLSFGNVAGVDTVTATFSGATVPAIFYENALASVATTIAITNGNAQSGTSGTVLALPLSVQLKDRFGNAVAGDTVTWTATGGTTAAPFTLSDFTGTASVQFTPIAGANSITASVNGTLLTTSFAETGQ